MENNYTVYIHIFPNNKVYIGITKMGIKNRWLNGKGYKTCRKLNFAIQKYGWENVKHEILYEHLTKEEAEQKEIELIVKYNSTDDNFGYNIEKGGNHQGKMSDETKRKLSAIMKGKNIGEKNGMYGKHHSIETRKKISENSSKYWQGKQIPLEIVEKTKNTKKMIYPNGYHHSSEAIKKIKETRIKKGLSYATEEERHKARLESLKRYKQKHKKEISEYNKKYRLEHKK